MWSEDQEGRCTPNIRGIGREDHRHMAPHRRLPAIFAVDNPGDSYRIFLVFERAEC